MRTFNIYLLIIIWVLIIITFGLFIHDFKEDSAKKSAKK